MMLGMNVQDLSALLNIYESEKKRTERGQSSSLLDWLCEEKREAEVCNANAQRSGRLTCVPAYRQGSDARVCKNTGLTHLID
jgi:hypothetical protein